MSILVVKTADLNVCYELLKLEFCLSWLKFTIFLHFAQTKHFAIVTKKKIGILVVNAADLN